MNASSQDVFGSRSSFIRMPPTWSDEGLAAAEELRRRFRQVGGGRGLPSNAGGPAE